MGEGRAVRFRCPRLTQRIIKNATMSIQLSGSDGVDFAIRCCCAMKHLTQKNRDKGSGVFLSPIVRTLLALMCQAEAGRMVHTHRIKKRRRSAGVAAASETESQVSGAGAKRRHRVSARREVLKKAKLCRVPSSPASDRTGTGSVVVPSSENGDSSKAASEAVISVSESEEESELNASRSQLQSKLKGLFGLEPGESATSHVSPCMPSSSASGSAAASVVQASQRSSSSRSGATSELAKLQRVGSAEKMPPPRKKPLRPEPAGSQTPATLGTAAEALQVLFVNPVSLTATVTKQGESVKLPLEKGPDMHAVVNVDGVQLPTKVPNAYLEKITAAEVAAHTIATSRKRVMGKQSQGGRILKRPASACEQEGADLDPQVNSAVTSPSADSVSGKEATKACTAPEAATAVTGGVDAEPKAVSPQKARPKAVSPQEAEPKAVSPQEAEPKAVSPRIAAKAQSAVGRSKAEKKGREPVKPGYDDCVADLHKTVAREPARVYCAASFHGYARKHRKLMWEVRQAECMAFEQVAQTLFDQFLARVQSLERVTGTELKAWCIQKKHAMLRGES